MSKSLKYLNHIKNDDFNMMIATYPPIPAYNGISKPEMFNIIRKELTALEIIKEKDVNIQRLMKCINITAYNNGLPKNRQLTQEEFNIVKEVMTNDKIE